MFALVGLEFRTLYLDRNEHDGEQAYARCVQLNSFKKIADGIKQELDDTKEILDIERRGRSQNLSPDAEKSLIQKWGQVSKLPTRAVEGATATLDHPSQFQRARRTLDAGVLGLPLKKGASSAATVIHDGTNEAGKLC